MTELRKIQFGSGGQNLPPPWENYDREIDIRERLPFPDACASRLYCSHLIEHVNFQQGWLFLEECYRVLCHGGVVRIAFPDILRIERTITPAYIRAVQQGGYGNGSHDDAIKAAVFAHGHQAVWTEDAMHCVLETIGFTACIWAPGLSEYADLRGVEQHGKVVGEAIAEVETSIVEGTKHR